MAPSSSGTEIQQAARHLAEGRPEAAVRVLEALAAAVPAYVTAHALLARAYESCGRREDALAAWHRAYFLMPGSALVRRQRQRLLRVVLPPPAVEEEQPAAEREWTATEEERPTAKEEREAWGEAAWDPPLAEEDAGREQDDADWRLLDEIERPRHAAPDATEAAIRPPGRAADGAFSEELPAAETPIDAAPDGAGADPEEPYEEDPHPWVEDAGPTLEPTTAGTAPLGELDDLDALIAQLENAPRIRPDPDLPDGDDEDDSDAEEVVSETLARIYESQRQYADAARVYERLAAEQPHRAEELTAKAAGLRRRVEE